MKARVVAVVLWAGMLAGCATVHETGKDMKGAGAAVKEDFRNMGPAVKKGMTDVKEGFGELGQGVSRDFKESVQELKR